MVHDRTRRFGPLRSLHEESQLPQDIRRSLFFILFGNIFGTVNGIVCQGNTVAMIGLATSLGGKDLALGLLQGIFQGAAIFQIPFSILVNRTHRRKTYMLTFGLIGRLLWMFFGLIPLIVPMEYARLQIWLLIFLVGISSVSMSFINVCWFPWFSDLCPVGIRSRWIAVRQMITNIVSIVCGILVAVMLDHLPPQTRYVIVFIFGGLMGVLDMLCFAFCREVFTAPPKRIHFREVVRSISKNRRFLSVMAVWTFWCFVSNFSGNYFNAYSMNVMGLSSLDIMIFGTIAISVGIILTVRNWGRAIFRFGEKNVFYVTGMVYAFIPLVYLFSSPGNIWPTLIRNFFGAMFWCGWDVASNSLELSLAPDEMRPSYIAVFSCVSCFFGIALGSVSGGALLTLFERMNWFTGWFDRYKALFTFSAVLTVIGLPLLISRIPSDTDKTVKDLVKAIFTIPPHKKRP